MYGNKKKVSEITEQRKQKEISVIRFPELSLTQQKHMKRIRQFI